MRGRYGTAEAEGQPLRAVVERMLGRDGIHCDITTYICLKKVRAKCKITSQIRTSEEVIAKSPRAKGSEKGERMESVFCFRANSVGGQESKK